MRISDWSSDVCSSDLESASYAQGGRGPALGLAHAERVGEVACGGLRVAGRFPQGRPAGRHQGAVLRFPWQVDRKSVVEGKSVSVRVDLGGRRLIKKKINTKIMTTVIDDAISHH